MVTERVASVYTVTHAVVGSVQLRASNVSVKLEAPANSISLATSCPATAG
jgi:hypothetical protein